MNMSKTTIEQQLFDKLERLLLQVDALNERIGVLERTQLRTVPFGPTIPWQPLPSFNQCTKCGLKLDTVMGYVCSQPDCPTGLGPIMCTTQS